VSLRALLGEEIHAEGPIVGTLLDLTIDNGGRIVELELDENGAIVHVPAADSSLAPSRTAAGLTNTVG
jgi:hypothetical protein